MLTWKHGVDLCLRAGNFSWADCRGRPPKVSRARKKPWCQDTLSEDTCANERRAHDETIREFRRWTDAKIGASKRSIRPTTPDDLRAYFETYGEVVEAPIMKDRGTGRPRGFGFVVFADPDVAEKVASEEHTINGRQVEAKKAVPREGDSNGARQQPQMQTQGKPNADATAAQQGQGIRTKKIFVGGLPPTITEDTFRAYFEEFGQIQDAVVMYDHATNRPRGFGFVTFETEESVDKVFEQGNMHELNEKKVEIKRAVPKDQMPPGPQRGPRPPYPAGPMPGVGQRQMGMQGSYGRGFNAGYGAHGALGGAALGAFGAGYGSGFAGASQTYSAYSSVVAGQPGGFTPGYTPPTNYSQAAATGTGYSQQQAGQSPQQPPPGYAQTPYSQLYQHGASFGGYNQIGAFGAYDAAAYGASAHPPGTNLMQQGEMQEGGVGGSFNHFGVQSGYAPADGRDWQ